MKRMILAALCGAVLVSAFAYATALSTNDRKRITLAVNEATLSDIIGDSVEAVDDGAIAATFTVGAEASNNIDTQIVFKDGRGNAIGHVFKTYCWQSESSVGAGFVTTAGTAALSAVTNGSVESRTSGKSADALTSAAGLLGIRLTQTSATVPNAYLCCADELGRALCSGVVDFN